MWGLCPLEANRESRVAFKRALMSPLVTYFSSHCIPPFHWTILLPPKGHGIPLIRLSQMFDFNQVRAKDSGLVGLFTLYHFT